MLCLNQRGIFRSISWCVRLVVNYLGPPLTRVLQIPGIPTPLLPLRRNWDSVTPIEHAGLTCGQVDTQEGLSYKFTPWVMGHKANMSKITYFLFWAASPVLVSASLATHRGG